MANFSFNLPAPNGWNDWIYVRGNVDNIQLADAPFPPNYTPSSSFWLRSLISHCLIDWMIASDFFTLFLNAGGSSGTLDGALGGISVANLLKGIKDQQSFGIGQSYPGPSLGYCIADIFKQEVYVRFDIISDPISGTVLPINIIIELLQNYKFNRFYVNHGEIKSYKKENNKNILVLDIDRSDSPFLKDDVNGDKINIIKKNGDNFTVNVQSIEKDWSVVISDPGDKNIEPGDFYQLNTTWILDDPYLLSGFWVGSENEKSDKPSSGLNLYRTSHNSPYEEGKIMGVYIWKKKGNETNETNEEIVQPSANSSMFDQGGNEWTFWGFGNSSYSNIYSNDTRYKEIVASVPIKSDQNTTEQGQEVTDVKYVIRYEKMSESSNTDYNQLIGSENTEYLRIDISSGGYRNRHNWYAQCLVGSYIESNGSKFKIIGHPGANIIDVNIKSIDGKSNFDPYANQNYSIINQYAWIINENYCGDLETKKNYGVFSGDIKISKNTGKISNVKDASVLMYKSNGLSFEDRFKTEINIENNKQIFNKFKNWKVVLSGQEYNIKSLKFGDKNDDGLYDIDVEFTDNYDSINGRGFISFDKSFDVIGSFSQESGYSMALDITTSLVGNTPFILSDRICLNGEYFSNPYEISIPTNSRIGFCDGFNFGIEANGSAQSNIGQFDLVSTLSKPRGMSSLYHDLRKEDWVAYNDAETNKLTIRSGYLDFKDIPRKMEVSIGEPSSVENVSISGYSISLDKNKERLRRLFIKVPSYQIPSSIKPINSVEEISSSLSYENSSVIGFLINKNDFNHVHGFIINGGGKVNLQQLSVMGIYSGIIDGNAFKYDDNKVSPVLVSKKSSYQQLDDLIVDIGMKTQDSPIYVYGGQLSEAKAEYINENQTIESNGFFDIYRTDDAETFCIYSQQIGPFKYDKTNLSNSSDNGTKFFNDSGLMIVATNNDALRWRTPLVDKSNIKNSQYIYPIMVLNGVNYLSYVYNPLSYTITFFVKSYDNGNPYIACLTVCIPTLLYDGGLIFCETVESGGTTRLPFFWRKPLLKECQWIGSGDCMELANDDTLKKYPNDKYTKIIGTSATKSQIAYDYDISIISTSMMPDGSFVLFYQSEGNIKALFSIDNGDFWRDSDIIYARNAVSATMIGNYLYYVTSQGIFVKFTDLSDFYSSISLSINKKEGKDMGDLERSLQNKLDAEKFFTIYNGTIDPQRLSGYISDNGIIRVFFYDDKGLLTCCESSNGSIWNIANNF